MNYYRGIVQCDLCGKQVTAGSSSLACSPGEFGECACGGVFNRVGKWEKNFKHASFCKCPKCKSEPASDSANFDPSESILQEAERIINEPRRDSYGDAKESFQRIADVWGAVLKTEVTPHQVALCMIGLKLCREVGKPHRDNLVDIAGYAALAELTQR